MAIIETNVIRKSDTRRDGSQEIANEAVAAPLGRRQLDAVDLIAICLSHRLLLLKSVLIVGFLTAVIVVLMPNVYTAETVIMPPRQNQSLTASMLGQLAPLAGIMGKEIGGQNSSELYVAMLKSRTVADSLCARFSLMDYYKAKTRGDARQALAEDSDITARKDGVILIAVENRDPRRAADIANAYVDELKKLNSELAITEASRRRLFFEKERAAAKDDLTKAESELQKTQEKSGLIQLDSQSKAIIESVAYARAQVAASEVRLRTMRSFATDQNPDLKVEEQQLAALKAQLAQLERGQNTEVGNILVPTGNVPAAGLAYLQRLRDVKYSETLFDLLSKEYEIAKIDEARESAVVQSIDPAVVPEHKSKPKRLLTVVLAMIITALATLGFVILRALYLRWISLPGNRERVGDIWKGTHAYQDHLGQTEESD